MSNTLLKTTDIVKVKNGWACTIHILVEGKPLTVQEFAETKKKLKEKVELFDIDRYAFDKEKNEFYTKYF